MKQILFIAIFLFSLAVPSYSYAATLYWFNDDSAADANWETLTGNWWTDATHLSQAGALPTGDDDVITVAGEEGPVADPSSWTAPASIDATATGFTASSSFAFLNLGVTGNVEFYGEVYFNSATITGDAVFNDNSRFNPDGIVSGNAVFNNSSRSSGSVTGNAVFNDIATMRDSGLIAGNATFNDLSWSSGTVEGDATFAYGTGGVLTLSEDMAFGLVEGTTSGVDNNPITSYVFNSNSYNNNVLSHPATYNDSSIQGGTVTADVIFNDDSYNGGTITGSVVFNDSSFNDGSEITGDVVFNDLSFNGGTITGDAQFTSASSSRIILTGEMRWGIVSGDVTDVDDNPITMYVFNGESGSINESIINGDALFNDVSAPGFESTINGDVVFNNESRFSAGIVTGNAIFNDESYMVDPDYGIAIVQGNATFNDSSYNDSVIEGDAIFNDTSFNSGNVEGDAQFTSATSGELILTGQMRWGSVDGEVTDADGNPITLYIFNDQSFLNSNYYFSQDYIGVVDGDAIFNDTSFNEGIVTGDAQFNYEYATGGVITLEEDMYLRVGEVLGLISGNDGVEITEYIFNSNSRNSSTFFGNATFNDSSQNGVIINGTFVFNDESTNSNLIVGVATFNDDSVDSGTVEADVVGPAIRLGTTLGNTTAVITIRTNEFASTTLEYGLDETYGTATSSATATRKKVYSLTGLTACTTYSYEVVATDSFGNASTSATTLITTGCSDDEEEEVVVAPTTVSSKAPSRSGGGGGGGRVSAPAAKPVVVAGLELLKAENEEQVPFINTINSLILQIRAIMEARGMIAPSAANENAAFNRDLEVGSVGDDVKALQMFLNKNGFTVAVSGPGSMGSETTLFGAGTKAALIKFQQANGITPASGYFGPKTRAMVK